MKIKQFLLDKFDKQTLSNLEILENIKEKFPNINKNTLNWNLSELVKEGKIYRVGRGKYCFDEQNYLGFPTPIYQDVEDVVGLIKSQFKYVKIVLTDSKWLSEYLVQQPFATIVKFEVEEPAVDAIVSLLRKQNVKAFTAQEIEDADKYFMETRVFVIDKIRFYNPTKKSDKGVSIAKLEKIMVDIVCDDKIYRQYQGWELENFFANVTDKCSINFSTLTKYSSSRGKKKEVVQLLANNKKYELFLRS